MSFDDNMQHFAERVSREKLQTYTQILRENLIKAGVDPQLFDEQAQTANLELQLRESEESIASKVLRSEENRGIDSVGRLVVEYCFVRSTNGQMIWPEYSDEDTMARWQFSDNVLPRPLMRYFLISMRGTINEIDGFKTSPFLYEETPEQVTNIQQTLGEFIEEFKGPFGTGESAIDWADLYNDPRSQQIALNLVQNMLSQIKTIGLEAYLNRLVEYREQDPRKTEHNLMQRPFTLEDAQQITHALEAAEKQLSSMTH